MRIVMFYHSLISDWNHGNAHFLRGVAWELLSRGHDVRVFEPRDAWSVRNLLSEEGITPVRDFEAAYPGLTSTRYDLNTLDLDQALEGADLALVHEWNDHDLVARIGRHRSAARSYRLLFHDTHHRAASEPQAMASYDLRHYDGVLAFGEVIRQIYLREGWAQRAWTWHEAADTRVFKPIEGEQEEGDLVWVGNWGDDERSAELREFLLNPVRELGLRALIQGVRYPEAARAELAAAGIRYGGWLANYKAPRVFARHRLTVHVPRRPYVEALPGIPTIRPFEALACGIPLISAPWHDSEGLFTEGEDYLRARNGAEMKQHIRALLNDSEMASALAAHGLATVRSRHTCAHRVDELMGVLAELGTARHDLAHREVANA